LAYILVSIHKRGIRQWRTGIRNQGVIIKKYTGQKKAEEILSKIIQLFLSKIVR